jgi:hypothetical protein
MNLDYYPTIINKWSFVGHLSKNVTRITAFVFGKEMGMRDKKQRKKWECYFFFESKWEC